MTDKDTMRRRIDRLKAENAKLLAIAAAAGEYLDARQWAEGDDVLEERGEALAKAMNAWKGIGPSAHKGEEQEADK